MRTRALMLAAGWLGLSVPALAAPGPGLGNIDCTEAEKFKPLVFLENTQGGPTGTNVVIMTGGYLMLNYANDSGGPPGILTFFDVSNPRQPRSVRRIDNPDTRQFREAHSFPIAIIDGKHFVAIQTIRGIQFWDVTDVATAARIGSIDLPGVNGGDYENVAWQASWQGRYLFVSGGNLGVFVIDAANPTQPRLVKTVPTGQSGGFRVGPLYALGDHLIYSNMDQNGALGVLDISKADAPALLSTKSGLPRMYAFIASGDRIYGAGRDGDFTIHSWADPTRITEVKIARIEQDSLYVATQDHFAFSGRQNNFVKIDLTDEKNPRVVGEGTLSREHPDHGQVTPLGNLIYIGNDHGSGSAFFCHQTGKDVTPPGIVQVFPADGSTHQPLTSRVTISWSDYIDTRSVSPSTIAIRPAGGAPLHGIYSYAFNTLSFGPDQPFAANTTYEIVISAGGVKDVMGNGVASERIVRFSTGDSIDVPPPDAGAGGSSGSGGTSTGGSSAGGASGSGGVSGDGGASGSGGSSGGALGSGGASGSSGASGGGASGIGGASGGRGGNGAAAGSGGANRGAAGGPALDDSEGCGCRTPLGSTNGAPLAGLLGLALLLRRRRCP